MKDYSPQSQEKEKQDSLSSGNEERSYISPDLETEKIFEDSVLGCGKVDCGQSSLS